MDKEHENKKILLLTVDHHFARTKKGDVWVKGIHDENFWNKYLSAFDKLYTVARIKEVGEVPENWLYSSYSCVEFQDITFFQGASGIIKNYFRLRSAIKKVIEKHEITHAIFRLPSNVGFLTWLAYRKTKKPYALEIVTNMADIKNSACGLIEHLAARLWSIGLKKACNEADGISYVTSHAIQKDFPPGKGAFTSTYSSIDLLDDFYDQRKPDCKNDTPFTLIHVSTLEGKNKGHSVFFRVLKRLSEKGHNVSGTIVGGGKYFDYYREQAEEMGISDIVHFVGQIADKQKLKQQLLNADLMLFPSEAEGLPRVVIEAMACSLPCIASDVGGTSELLAADFLASPKDEERFYQLTENMLNNKIEYYKQSQRNYKKALEYSYDALNEKRYAFYDKLRKLNKNKKAEKDG